MQKIRYFVMDVDGTMTDGKIYIGDNGELMKVFSIIMSSVCVEKRWKLSGRQA